MNTEVLLIVGIGAVGLYILINSASKSAKYETLPVPEYKKDQDLQSYNNAVYEQMRLYKLIHPELGITINDQLSKKDFDDKINRLRNANMVYVKK